MPGERARRSAGRLVASSSLYVPVTGIAAGSPTPGLRAPRPTCLLERVAAGAGWGRPVFLSPRVQAGGANPLARFVAVDGAVLEQVVGDDRERVAGGDGGHLTAGAARPGPAPGRRARPRRRGAVPGDALQRPKRGLERPDGRQVVSAPLAHRRGMRAPA